VAYILSNTYLSGNDYIRSFDSLSRFIEPA